MRPFGAVVYVNAPGVVVVVDPVKVRLLLLLFCLDGLGTGPALSMVENADCELAGGLKGTFGEAEG